VVICLERGADCLHNGPADATASQTPSSLASFKSRLVLPFRYRTTQVVLEKRPLNGCIISVKLRFFNFCTNKRIRTRRSCSSVA